MLPLRSLTAASCVAALYFTAKAFSLSVTRQLLFGAAGLTAGLIIFTLLLSKRAREESAADGSSGKEGEENG